MDKRYQVFISSTFKDLQEERQEVMQALLELDCIPSGMELFPAANDTQWEIIKKVIFDCDYYILILAGRYGSLAEDGYSFTEKEYDYACGIGKPILAFTHRDVSKIAVGNSEGTDTGKDKLKKFKKKVEKRLCKQWGTAIELGSVVSRSMVQLKKTTPAVGWVKADKVADAEAANEILNLRKRNEELKNALKQEKANILREKKLSAKNELPNIDDRMERVFTLKNAEEQSDIFDDRGASFSIKNDNEEEETYFLPSSQGQFSLYFFYASDNHDDEVIVESWYVSNYRKNINTRERIGCCRKGVGFVVIRREH